MPADCRNRFRKTMAWADDVVPPRFENDFADDTVRLWRAEGRLDSATPEDFFQLDRWDEVQLIWRRNRGEKTVIQSDDEIARFRRLYDPSDPERFPPHWSSLVEQWGVRDYVVSASPWDEGLLQVMGVSDSSSLVHAVTVLCERPEVIEAAMEHYGSFLEALIPKVLASVQIDLALFYEPIASNGSPVISPETYRRFAMAALKRVVGCLDRHGVAYRFMWSGGNVAPLIPLWIEAGINGLALNRPGEAGISYQKLRETYGRALRLIGGIDWRILMGGREAIERELTTVVAPLLEQGGYIPYLDDTVRSYVPFESYAYYRAALNALLDRLYSDR